MRKEAPIGFVPQLGSTVFTRRGDIFTQEKRIEVFSSHQPGGLMNLLMGHNMMRHVRARPDVSVGVAARGEGDLAAIEARCNAVSKHINTSILSVPLAAGRPMQSIRANVKLAISGGQNEPRDAISGSVCTSLSGRVCAMVAQISHGASRQ